ncbi:hypothetical protein Asp14428_37500 [Actinoplanes sp. NBRC 14428]|nr:hypothetical protein Asp14428_37500 [Actinoplanes sp. NBRC 14428]
MKPHRTDGISLSFGLIFLLVAAWWAVSQVVTVRLPALGWLVASVLILFGAIGLLGAIRSGRRTEVAAPVAAEAQVETPGGLPADLHADIVRELLHNPADRIDLPPVPQTAPVPAPVPSAPPAQTASAQAAPAPEPPTSELRTPTGDEPPTSDLRTTTDEAPTSELKTTTDEPPTSELGTAAEGTTGPDRRQD